MTFTLDPSSDRVTLPDHTQLPESDGTFVKNFQEHPQSILLTDSIQQFQIQNRNKRYIILKVKLTRICKHRSITKHKFD
jgi:hypothetical protein